jgi:hypothetical protein
VRIRATVCGLAGGLLAWMVCGVALGQDDSGPKKAVPTPAGKSQQVRPGAAYGSLQAAQDAYRAGEQKRWCALSRQWQLVEGLRCRNPWVAAYVPSLAEIAVYRGLRAFEQAFGGETVPLSGLGAYVPGRVSGEGYYPGTRQPIGHEKIWTGPNGYVYRPRYAPAGRAELVPVSPVRQTPTRAVRPAEPVSVPERIPTPPPESGPREF